MPLVVTCPSCGVRAKVPDAAVGRKVRCPKCGEVFQPQPVAGAPSSPRQSPGVSRKALLAVGALLLVGVVSGLTVWLLTGWNTHRVVLELPFSREQMEKSLQDARKTAAKAGIRTLTSRCQQYELTHNGERPPDLVAVVDDPDDSHLKDPWGKPFCYEARGTRNSEVHPDIWTTAPDGTEIGNWPKGR